MCADDTGLGAPQSRFSDSLLEGQRYTAELNPRIWDLSADAVFVKDEQGRYLMINAAGARFLGTSVEEVIGKDDAELVPSETARLISENDRMVMATAEARTYEHVRKVAGVTRTFLSTISPNRDQDGKVVGLIGIARDITENRALQAERDRLLAQRRLQIDRLPLAYILIDADGRVADWNPAAEKMFGYAKVEVLGQVCIDLIVPLPLRCQMQELVHRILAGDVNAQSDSENRTKDGRLITCQWFNTPLLEDGRFVGIVLLAQDITERKLAERARSQLAALVESSDDAIIGTSLMDIVESWNTGAERLFGYTADEIIGHPVSILVPPDHADGLFEIKERLIRGEQIEHVETLRMRKDGTCVHVLLSLSAIRDASGRIVGVSRISRDNTQRKQAEEALREYSERLQSISHRLLKVQESERSRLALELHDEVGQMLTGLRLILQPKGDLPADVIKSTFDQAQRIVDELLERVRSLSFDLRPAALDQLGLLPGLLALFERYTEQTGVLVNFKHRGLEERFTPEIETTVYRIVQEALTNVARHAVVNAVTVRVWASTDMLGLLVEDRGRGFDVQAALAAPRSSGLAGMRERVLLLSGQLSIESRLGVGTQITAEIPSVVYP